MKVKGQKLINMAKAMFLLSTVYCLLPTLLYAAQEMLKTQKVKVGEKAPLTDTLKKAHNEGKVILLLLLPNPMQCDNCDKAINILQEMTGYDDVVYIVKGGQDIIGAADEETITLKRTYGFVSVGQIWTFIIDKDGVLRKIYMGDFTRDELEGILDDIMGRKK